MILFCLRFQLCCLADKGSQSVTQHVVSVESSSYCAPLVANLFLFCYERDFMKDLSSDNQADVIKAFNSTSRYLDDLLNIDNPFF